MFHLNSEKILLNAVLSQLFLSYHWQDVFIVISGKALEICPNSFEAYYARARAKRDNRQYSSALSDLRQALTLAPQNRELRRLLLRVQVLFSNVLLTLFCTLIYDSSV